MLNDGSELGIGEEAGKLRQGSLECGWLGVVAGCRMELDEADNRVADHLVEGTHIVDQTSDPRHCSLTTLLIG